MVAKRRSRRGSAGIEEQLRASGLTQREFSEREGIPQSTLTYWLRKDRLEGALKRSKAARTTLVAVTQEPSSSRGFIVEAHGFRIEIPRDLTVEEWRRFQEAWAS